MTYAVIKTGSKGNGVLFNDSILVDCGLTWKEISPYYKQLKLVLLSHEHSDHFKPQTIHRLAFERPSLRFGCCEWMLPLLFKAGVAASNMDVYEPGKPVCYAGLDNTTIEVVKTFHNVPNCGYKIAFGNGEKLFYATDCGTLDNVEAKGYDWYFIESNHTEADIQRRILEKQEQGEFAYEYAAAKNHLSEEQARAWLTENAGLNSRYLFLHQHKKVT